MLEKDKLRDFNIKELTLLHNLEKNLLTADSVDIYIDITCCDENKLCKAKVRIRVLSIQFQTQRDRLSGEREPLR